MIQVTVAKIRGYGPWTLTLGSDREHRLQMLQASLYAESQRLFSEQDALLFPNRHDEYMAVSNGLDEPGHNHIRDSINGRFEVNLEMHAGRGPTPYAANGMAHRARREGRFMLPGGAPPDTATILHMDIDDLTSSAETATPYDIAAKVLRLHHTMSEYFVERDSLAFFMGGDNFMVAASPEGVDAAAGFVDMVRDQIGISLNCGVGRAATGRGAAALATKSLDAIRDMRDSGSPISRVYESSC